METIYLKAPRELLTAFDRPVRLPLPIQIETLVRSRPPAPPTDRSSVEAWARLFNQLALIELHFGRVDCAADLCRWQIDWVARQLVPALGQGYAVFAFQPWVNLARLDLRMGRRGEGIARLAMVRQGAHGGAVTLRTVAAARRHHEAMCDLVPELPAFLGNVYMTELLLLAIRDDDTQALEMAAAGAAEMRWADDAPALEEARMLMRVSDRRARTAALAPVTAHTPPGDILVRLALRLRALETGGDRRADILEIAEAALRLFEIAPSGLCLALVQHAVHKIYDPADESVFDLCRKGLAGAFDLNDVLLIKWFHTASNGGFNDRDFAEKLYSQTQYRAVIDHVPASGAGLAAHLDALTHDFQVSALGEAVH